MLKLVLLINLLYPAQTGPIVTLCGSDSDCARIYPHLYQGGEPYTLTGRVEECH